MRVLSPSSVRLTGSGWKNFIDLPRYTLSNQDRLGYDGVVYDLGDMCVCIPSSMETARGFKITVSEASYSVRRDQDDVRDGLALYDISASNTHSGLILNFNKQL